MHAISDLEVDIAETCNLKCAQCTHSAPFFKPNDNLYTVEEFEQDIINLKRISTLHTLRLVGGEPLTNKRLVEYINKARQHCYVEKISMFTNGLLLRTAPKELFEKLDFLRISVYNLSEVQIRNILEVVGKIATDYPLLNVHANRIRFFAKFNSVEKNTDPHLIQKIYERCYYKKDGLNLYRGYLYRCFASRKKYQFLNSHRAEIVEDFENLKQPTDALAITSTTTASDLAMFLTQTTPLEACKWCLGCSGRPFKHHQLQPNETDIATLADLDFEGGKKYLSNLLLSWRWDDFERLVYDEFFYMEHISSYKDHFSFTTSNLLKGKNTTVIP